MRPQPLIAVRDVEASSRWYQSLLRCESGHGGPEYERLMFDGELVMQLHHWDAHEHSYMGDPTAKPYGNGVLLWFEVDDFDACVTQARELKAKILEAQVSARSAYVEGFCRPPSTKPAMAAITPRMSSTQ